MSEFLEIIMILCFGASWPFNVMKAYKARTAKGKSLLFLCLIIIGYIAGISSKFLNEAYMASINYKHMFIQKVQHDQFREKIHDMNLEHLDENTEKMLTEILEYLTNWLINHILEHDKQIGM